MITRKWKYLAVCIAIGSVSLLANQNCSKVGFEGDAWQKEISASDEDLDEISALAYGSATDDRQFLQDKLNRYKAPGLNEIFSKWRRISGPAIYNSVADIDIASSENSFCYSSLDPVTGVWADTVNPANGKAVSPAKSSLCINLGWFSAVSWIYLTNGRLHHGTNSGNFNGFISGVKLDQYTNTATVTSPDTDDDEISLIVAAAVDADGVVHTLSAGRTQGGTLKDTNWYFIYRKGNTRVSFIKAQAFDQLNKNDTGGQGDKKGWNGRKALIQVQRDGNIIKAKTSKWQTDDSLLALDDTSEIQIDLSDTTLGLDIFKGIQYYGYGVQSQAQSQFYDVSFSTPLDQNYVFDLEKSLVYKANASGYYDLLSKVTPYSHLGTKIRVKNPETQKMFRLYSNKTYTEITE